MPQEDLDSTDAIRSGTRPLKPGIIVFSSTRKALYANEAAKAMLMRLKLKQNGHSAHAIPRVVDHVLEDMVAMLRKAGRPHGWTELTPKPSIAACDPPICMKAFGMGAVGDHQHSLIVITMQETPPTS